MISGLKFPLTITSLGRFATTTEDDKIQQNLERIANTALRERWMEPNMGTVGYSALFRNVNNDTMNQIKKLVQEAINEQEPRVSAKIIGHGESTTGKIYFDIYYVRRDIDQAGQLRIEVGE